MKQSLYPGKLVKLKNSVDVLHGHWIDFSYANIVKYDLEGFYVVQLYSNKQIVIVHEDEIFEV